MIWKFYTSEPDVCHYLFGTMHLATKEAYTFADLAKKYILKSALYAGEMDLSVSHGQDMAPYFMLGDEQNFHHFFRPKQYNKYRKIILKSFHFDLINYDKYTPFFINNLLAELSLKKTYDVALDHNLWQFAMENAKEMIGVESFEDQVNILKQIPIEFQVKSFKDSMKNISSFRNKLQNLNGFYADGNVDQLYKSSKKSMGEIRKLMIYDRNQMMTKRIIELSKVKPSFFAIGAAHFPGGKGIIALLKKQGFKVKLLTS